MKYLNSKNDVLSWRPAIELEQDVLRRLKETAEYLTVEETHRLYDSFLQRLVGKINFESSTSAKIEELLLQVETAHEDELVGLHRQFSALAAEHFKKNDSAAALFETCGIYRSRLVTRILSLAVEKMEEDGFGPSPVPFAWVEAGTAGRGELSISGEYKALIVYGRDGKEADIWIENFARLAVDLLDATAVVRLADVSPADSTWRRSISGWRKLMTQGRHVSVEPIIPYMDIRHLYGDPLLTEELTNLIHAVIQSHPEQVRQESRRVARLPLATGLLGWFRVERTGVHRGEVNLHGHAYLPLVSLIRIMAATADIHVTNTGERIRSLLTMGKLSVEMAENLLEAYHVINRQRIPLQQGEISASAPGYLDPEYLTEEEEQTLKMSLETVANLQKLLYSAMAEKW